MRRPVGCCVVLCPQSFGVAAKRLVIFGRDHFECHYRRAEILPEMLDNLCGAVFEDHIGQARCSFQIADAVAETLRDHFRYAPLYGRRHRRRRKIFARELEHLSGVAVGRPICHRDRSAGFANANQLRSPQPRAAERTSHRTSSLQGRTNCLRTALLQRRQLQT